MKYTDVLLGRYLSNCSGGGSGGDFSTATIHIVNTTISSIQGHCPLIEEIDGVTYATGFLYTEEEAKDFTVILSGNNGTLLSFVNETYTYTISGNIEKHDPDYPDFIVTGDCTITVSE